MGVLIDNKQNKHKISPEKIRQKARAILNALDSPDGELSILIVDDPQIALLNKDYLHREGPTNVIAFPMREGNFSDINPQLLGDVVISIETAKKEGEKADISMEQRFTELLVHGILHLFGYDHEKTEQEAVDMQLKTDALLKLIERI
ncbi:MAG: rRNA maturation RNase YbeY [Deltaproteobacteria bacterium]|nr:rRNA maturation RNase YbeY [Deltaproteobacteria bacterium]MBW2011015.1 rRNA maturation RNase YbeY [Deltaproteobacteria bacterium]MBW2099948.1 rRNA maturation RNase YbeY [Deltaproteobacteria bacterium]